MFTSRTARRITFAGCALALVVGTAACGSDHADGPALAQAPASSVAPATSAPATDAPASTASDSTGPPSTEASSSTEAPPSTKAPATTDAPTTTAALVAEPGPLSIVTRDYEFVGMPDTLRAGTYSISVANEGAEPHEMVIFQPTTGKSLDELEAGGPETFANDARIGGFFAPAGPGSASGPQDVTLDAGEWTVVCFIPAATDGLGHFHHGMLQTITVVD